LETDGYCAAVTGPRFRLGVDFGTTHTVAALSFPDGRVQPLLFESNPLLPSAVFAEEGRRLLVGRDAERSSRVDPARFEPNPKRRVDEGTVLLGGMEFTTANLVAAVLHRVYEEAVRVAGGPPAATVLTHPADWAATRLQVLAEAAGQAGIGAVTLVPEPLAAAAYFSSVLRHRVAAGAALVVYDFGGGTFDISVIRRRPDGGWDVVATEGLDDVGGIDLDAAVVERVGASVAPADPVRWQRLMRAGTPEEQRRRRLLWDEVRTAKEQLSRTAVAVVHVPLFDTDVHVTREEFEQLARPWLERTVALTAATLFRTGLRPDQLAGVVLVGGSSRIPMVATLLHQRLGMAPTVLDQPELVVAQGSLAAVPGPAAGAGSTPTMSAAAAVPPAPSPPPGHTPPMAHPPPTGQPAAAGHAAPMSPAPAMMAAGAPPGSAPGPGPVWPSPTGQPVGKRASRSRRRTPVRLLAVLSAFVVALVLGGVALANLVDDDDPGQGAGKSRIDVRAPQGGGLGGPPTGQATEPATPAPDAATEAGATPPAGGGTVVLYEVEASGRGNVGTVEYLDKDNELIRRSGIPLPWRLQFTTSHPNFTPMVITQRTGGGDGGPVTCRVTVNGKVTDETTTPGKYAAPMC
jgi:hypothetical protein